MRILHLSQADCKGGANIAAYRIHQSLLANGLDSELWVVRKFSADPSVFEFASSDYGFLRKGRGTLDMAPTFIKRSPSDVFSINWLTIKAIETMQHAYDIIHCHWAHNGILSIAGMGNINKPIVWTMHDMWLFTGGCHYSHGCSNYMTSCRKCPELNSIGNIFHLSSLALRYKALKWKKCALYPVAPSKWMAGLCEASHLFRGHSPPVIPYPINTNIFRFISMGEARRYVGISTNKTIVLLIQPDQPRKGRDQILQLLHNIQASVATASLHFVIVGVKDKTFFQSLDEALYTEIQHIDNDNVLTCYYNAVDVYLFLSQEDNLPNTLIEAACCGTPVVANSVGGLSEILDKRISCFLNEFNSAATLKSINLLQSCNNPTQRKASSLISALRFSNTQSYDAYQKLYFSVSERRGRQT